MKTPMYFPKTSLSRGMIVHALWAIAITLVLMLSFQQSAVAQEFGDLPTLGDIQNAAGSSQSADADESRKILYGIVGEFGDAPLASAGAADHLMGKLFFVFNSVLFVVGVSFVIYKLVMAVAESAHEGEVLGKRMSGLWIPIRFGTGIFGMLPVFKGFSLAQAIMMSIAIIGIGLANMLVTTALSSTANFEAVIPAPGLTDAQHSTSIDERVVNSMFLMNICAIASNKHKTLMDGYLSSPASVYDDSAGRIRVVNANVNCGEVRVEFDESILRTDEGFNGGYRNPAIQYDAINALAALTFDERKRSLSEVQARVKPLAEEWYASFDEDSLMTYPLVELVSIAKEVNAAEKEKVLARAASVAESSNTAVKDHVLEKMKEGGWTSLGSWYATFMESNAAIQSAALATTTIVVQPKFDSGALPETMQNILLPLMIQQEAATKDCYLGLISGNELGECSIGQNVLRSTVGALLDNTGGAKMVNPIIAAKNIGDWLLIGVGAVMSAGSAVKIAQWVATKTPVGSIFSGAAGIAGKIASKGPLSGLFSWLQNSELAGMGGRLATVLFIGAMVLGMVYAVYIPFIPFLTWFSALVSYFASVIEGLVAAQVWAFSHLNSDGEGMGQKTEKGYIYILNMLLRPGLMVLGFFFASAILTLMGTFFLRQFGPALANVQGDTMTGPFIMIGALGVVMVTLIGLVQTVFNLVYEVPDRVISWFGHGLEARMAQNMDRSIENKMEGMARWGGNSALAEVVKGPKG